MSFRNNCCTIFTFCNSSLQKKSYGFKIFICTIHTHLYHKIGVTLVASFIQMNHSKGVGSLVLQNSLHTTTYDLHFHPYTVMLTEEIFTIVLNNAMYFSLQTTTCLFMLLGPTGQSAIGWPKKQKQTFFET